jgi:hypothetical protein
VDLEDKPKYLPPFLTLQLLTKIRIITSALQDERHDQILFILEMPQQQPARPALVGRGELSYFEGYGPNVQYPNDAYRIRRRPLKRVLRPRISPPPASLHG